MPTEKTFGRNVLSMYARRLLEDVMLHGTHPDWKDFFRGSGILNILLEKLAPGSEKNFAFFDRQRLLHHLHCVNNLTLTGGVRIVESYMDHESDGFKDDLCYDEEEGEED